MKSYDLIPDSQKTETLFIMESPHSNEISSGVPCTGDTGLRMSECILGNRNKSFGILLKENEESVKSFGIMNTFPFPLGIGEKLSEKQSPYIKLKELNWIDGVTNRTEFYNSHFVQLGEMSHLEEVTRFKSRLVEYVKECPKLKNLIFCGFISQSVYLTLFKKSIPPYNKLISNKTESGREINILFINHPSDKNKKWDFTLRFNF